MTSLPVASTPLDGAVHAPPAVAAVNLLMAVPAASAPSLAASAAYVAMYPKGTFLNFALAPAGGSVWMHVTSGAVTLALVPGTPGNLAAYASWARDGSARSGASFLPLCEGAAHASLTNGDVLIVPPGWCYALAATENTVAVAGSFLRADSLAVHLDALRIERYVHGVAPVHHTEVNQVMWHVAASYADTIGAKAAAKEPGFQAAVAARAEEMENEDRALAAAAARRAALAVRADLSDSDGSGGAAPNSAPPRGRLATAAKHAGPQRRAPAAPAPSRREKKRRRNPANDFIASQSEEEDESFGGGSGSEEEDEWRPTKRDVGRWGGGSNAEEDDDEPFEEGMDDDDDDDDDASIDSDDFKAMAQRSRRRRGQGTGQSGANAVGRGRTSTRFQGQMPAKLAALVHGDDGEMEQEWDETRAAAAVPAAKPIKLKLKVPGGGVIGTGAPPEAPPQQPGPSPVKIKLKLKMPGVPGGGGTILQTDGAADEDPDDVMDHRAWRGLNVDDLSEGDEQGLAALLGALRSWLREADGAAEVPASISAPWKVVATLEKGMVVLGLSLGDPQKTDLGAGNSPTPSTQQAAHGEAATPAAKGPGEEDGDENAPEPGSADRVVVEESVGPKARPRPLPRAAPSSGMAGRKGEKKLSARDRLKKKLGL